MSTPPPDPSAPTDPRTLSSQALGDIAIGRGPDVMPWTQLYFRLEGRIARRTFWLHGVLALLIVVLLGNILLDIAGVPNDSADKLVNVLLLWPYVALWGKRLHDYNRSAWWLAINFVPGVGSLAMLLLNGLMRGRRGPNRFGPVPAVRRDPLRDFVDLNSAH